MFFGQRVHPLNFAYAQVLETALGEGGGSVEIHAGTGRLRVRGETIDGGTALKLSILNLGVSDQAPYSDGLVAEYRNGPRVEPVPADVPGSFVFRCPTLSAKLSPAGVELTTRDGTSLLPPLDGTGLGQCGPNTIVRFRLEGVAAAYGLGACTGRLNRLGFRHDCYTVDVVEAFPHGAARNDFDPNYVAIPLVILRFADGRHLGLYCDSAERLNIDLGKGDAAILSLVAPDGPLPLFVLPGPTLRHIVRRFVRLSGRAAIPPTWALGYHQCRWGYRSAEEFRTLKESFARSDIPVSALWFDIDYMHGYRLFSWNATTFPDPAALTAELHAAGIRTVAIINPGVKREPGNPVYDEGATGGFFCRSPSGTDYVGEVWPGETVFPDFTLERTRRWWALRLAGFLRESGMDGAWLDMNDPATGSSSPDEMLFHEGRVPHARYHNQYAHLMALASQPAFDHVDRSRPFILTRSASTGTQRYAAVWTGDNASNWNHLRLSIAQMASLGLSGVAFNGPDVGGFMGHCEAELLGRWMHAAFLIPFLRNHCEHKARPQEPWQYDENTLNICRSAIRMRYRLLPYLYQCFFQHWLEGDPVLRPLCYEYDRPEYAQIDDQFLIGDALLAAPMLSSRQENPPVLANGILRQFRAIVLPPGRWFDLNHGQWVEGAQTLCYGVAADECPIFARDGAALPYYAGPLANGRVSWRELEIHLFASREPARLTYLLDDLVTRSYADGQYNRIHIEATPAGVGESALVTITENGPLEVGGLAFRPVFYRDLPVAAPAQVPLHYRFQRGAARSAEFEAKLTTRRWLQQDLAVFA